MSAGLNFHRHMNVSRARGLLMAMDTANFYAQEAIEYTEEKKNNKFVLLWKMLRREVFNAETNTILKKNPKTIILYNVESSQKLIKIGNLYISLYFNKIPNVI